MGVSELVFSVLASLRDPATVPFGSAFPSPELFPLQRLARSMAQSVRDMPAREVIAEMTAGNPDLRRQIALRYMVSGVMLPMDELVITTGAMEALNLCLQVVTEPGDWWRSSRRRSTPRCRCWNGSSSKRWRFPSTRAKASIWRFSPIAWRTCRSRPAGS